MDNILSEIFPERLKEAREKAGYNSQEAFSDAYDQKYNNDGKKSSLGSIKKWERGAAIPKADSLVNICELLNCSLDYITGRQEVLINENINAYQRTGFDDNTLGNISKMRERNKIKKLVDPDKTGEYDIVVSLLGTKYGNKLIAEMAYRISRKTQYPKAKKVRTADYAGVGNWEVLREDLIESDNMQLYRNLLNWIENYNPDAKTEDVYRDTLKAVEAV